MAIFVSIVGTIAIIFMIGFISFVEHYNDDIRGE